MGGGPIGHAISGSSSRRRKNDNYRGGGDEKKKTLFEGRHRGSWKAPLLPPATYKEWPQRKKGEVRGERTQAHVGGTADTHTSAIQRKKLFQLERKKKQGRDPSIRRNLG